MSAAASSSDILPLVKCGFECEEEAAGEWVVRNIRLEEGLCAPYVCTLDLSQKGDDVGDYQKLLGASCTAIIGRDPLERRIFGIVNRVTDGGMRRGRVLIRVELVPALWALSQRVSSRIFSEPVGSGHRQGGARSPETLRS